MSMKNKYEIRGDQTAIFLNRRDGTVVEAIIDTSDLGTVKEFANTWVSRWDPAMRSYYVYGVAKVDGKRKNVHLHRLILNVQDGLFVDHYDHDTLNNKKSNLRAVTHAQNMQNKRPTITNKYSGVRGVTWDKRYNKWHASFKHKGRRYFCGYHSNLEDADKAVSQGRAKMFPYSKDAMELNAPSQASAIFGAIVI